MLIYILIIIVLIVVVIVVYKNFLLGGIDITDKINDLIYFMIDCREYYLIPTKLGKEEEKRLENILKTKGYLYTDNNNSPENFDQNILSLMDQWCKREMSIYNFLSLDTSVNFWIISEDFTQKFKQFDTCKITDILSSEELNSISVKKPITNTIIQTDRDKLLECVHYLIKLFSLSQAGKLNSENLNEIMETFKRLIGGEKKKMYALVGEITKLDINKTSPEDYMKVCSNRLLKIQTDLISGMLECLDQYDNNYYKKSSVKEQIDSLQEICEFYKKVAVYKMDEVDEFFKVLETDSTNAEKILEYINILYDVQDKWSKEFKSNTLKDKLII